MDKQDKDFFAVMDVAQTLILTALLGPIGFILSCFTSLYAAARRDKVQEQKMNAKPKGNQVGAEIAASIILQKSSSAAQTSRPLQKSPSEAA